MSDWAVFSRLLFREIGTGFLLLAGVVRLVAADVPVSGSPAPEPAHPPSLPLWTGVVPGSEGKQAEKEQVAYKTWQDINYISVTNVHRPTLTPYLPSKAKATGAGVIIAPGGGHTNLAIDTEGYNVAAWLADHGIAAFVLKYRLAKAPGSTYAVEREPVADAQRALRLVRGHAAEWNLNPDAIGVLGFSAGGEVVARTAMAAAEGTSDADDPVDRLSARPSFQALIYPGNARVITPEAGTPPAFLVTASDDRTVPTQTVVDLYSRLHAANVPAELHVFASGGHGFGLGTYKPMPAIAWPSLFITWLGDRGFITRH